MSHFCIPGCTYVYKNAVIKRYLFKILCPEFAKSGEERNHRESLVQSILSIRDPTKGDKIKDMLHREMASICEAHFTEKDFTVHSKSKTLKLGSIPTLYTCLRKAAQFPRYEHGAACR
ncbi:uncharacterized protein LOC144744398 [Ciona intestinalis]